MHFFHPIQQSAPHIYHSALPLSPTSSRFHSWALGEKTKITAFDGRPDAWGIVVRTITASPKRFTCVETFGHRIAAGCDDGTVGIYDSITGVQRLSLSLEDPVQAMGGSPDDSILFCAHNTPSITAWDMQTGGPIHTFHLERNVGGIAVSLQGRYLAYGLSDGSVEVRGVVNTMGGAAIWTTSPATCFCWLEAEQLAVTTGELVQIWNIVTGTVLRAFEIRYTIQHMVYSLKFGRLAVMAKSSSMSEVTIINPRRTRTTSHHIYRDVSCYTFSQTAKELVCGMGARGLWLFNISMWTWKDVEHPGEMMSVSSLRDGTMVANVAGSSIQLLSLDGRHTPSHRPTISTSTMHVIDQDRIIVISPTDHNHIILLEPTAMWQLLKIPLQNTGATPTHHTPIVYASHKHLMAVCYIQEKDGGLLQLWGFHEDTPRWTAKVDGVLKLGLISPTAARFITLHNMGHVSCRVYVWNVQNGQLDAQLKDIPPPLDIRFTSDMEFCSHYHDHRISHTLCWKQVTNVSLSNKGGFPPYLSNKFLSDPLGIESTSPFFDTLIGSISSDAGLWSHDNHHHTSHTAVLGPDTNEEQQEDTPHSLVTKSAPYMDTCTHCSKHCPSHNWREVPVGGLAGKFQSSHNTKPSLDMVFCKYCDQHCTTYTLHSCRLDICDEGIITPLSNQTQEGRYLDVNDTREWVVSGPKRICWIPPGYIGTTQSSYCWIGYSLIMAGQDGMLRKLTFSGPP